MPYYISPPPQTPLTRFITAIIAVVVLAGTFMIGIVALLVVAVLGLIGGIGIWLRVAWIKRRLQKSALNPDINSDIPPASGHVIDAEYTVISEQQDHQDE